jgi:Bacterial TSP3 repeat
VRSLLDSLVAIDDEYRWQNYGTEDNPLIVIQPRGQSALDWAVPPICGSPSELSTSKIFGPHNPHTDGDGLRNGQEALMYHTNPTQFSSDGTGISDGIEVQTGTLASSFNATESCGPPRLPDRVRAAGD